MRLDLEDLQRLAGQHKQADGQNPMMLHGETILALIAELRETAEQLATTRERNERLEAGGVDKHIAWDKISEKNDTITTLRAKNEKMREALDEIANGEIHERGNGKPFRCQMSGRSMQKRARKALAEDGGA